MSAKLRLPIFILLALVSAACLSSSGPAQSATNERIVAYTADSRTQAIGFYWKDHKGKRFASIEKLKKYLESTGLSVLFVMNGGMFDKDHAPLGLFIEEYQVKKDLDTSSGKGNFYLKPNGVFYINKGGQAAIVKTEDFKPSEDIRFATQSGPMLLIDGEIHPDFNKGSDNLNIRNGAGILPDGKILFAISKIHVNFYDFAQYFKEAGCKNALYLDGFVSRAFIPEQDWYQLDGNFGVMIAVTAAQK